MARARPRDCTRNAGGVSLYNLPEDVWLAAVIVVVMNEDGSHGTYFQAEDLDELPDGDTQLALGSQIAAAWDAASISRGKS